MLDEKDANELLRRLITLRKEFKKTGSDEILAELKKHERECVEKFRYIITMHTNTYKEFPNYEDLNQEGYVALLRAMKTFKPNKGSWFWWCHQHIKTRISRAANAHSTIRIPIRIAKKTPPRKAKMPVLTENRISFCPEKTFEEVEIRSAIERAMKYLNRKQRKAVKIYYGLTGDKPNSINKLCKKMKMSRKTTLETLSTAVEILKQKIQI